MHTFLNWLQSIFFLGYFNFFLFNISFDKQLILKLLDLLFFLLFAHFHKTFMSFYFSFNVLVSFFDDIHVWI